MLGKYVAYKIGKRHAIKKMEKEQFYNEIQQKKEERWREQEQNARDIEAGRPPTYE
jgi:amino acid permease